MAILEASTPTHWNYFISLEDDLLRLARFVEPTTANFGTYSLELARLLFAAASEVDVVAKQLCRKLKPTSRASSIGRYKIEVLSAYPQMVEAEVKIPRYGLTLTPWSQWAVEESPLWWQAYNKVKHHRDSHFHGASLKNALNALSGLFVLLLFFYRIEGQEGRLSPDPAIFRIGQPFQVDRPFWGPDVNLYQLTTNS